MGFLALLTFHFAVSATSNYTALLLLVHSISAQAVFCLGKLRQDWKQWGYKNCRPGRQAESILMVTTEADVPWGSYI